MNRRGLTLIELVLSIAGGAAIALVIVLLVEPFNNLMFTMWRRGGSAEAQAAVTRMLREIERTRAPSDISAFTATRMTFTDIDDQVVDFRVSGTDLMRGADVLARNVQSLVFAYMDGAGVTATSAAQIRLVRLTLTITAGNQPVRMSSVAQIRNGVP